MAQLGRNWIKSHRPNLLVITQEALYESPRTDSRTAALFGYKNWKDGLTALLQTLRVPGMKKVILGNIPLLPESGPTCLAGHANDVQACSAPTKSSVLSFNNVERSAANANGARYVNTIPWFCSATCTAIIDKYGVYRDQLHIDSLWAVYLQNVLADSIGLPERVTSVALPARYERPPGQ